MVSDRFMDEAETLIRKGDYLGLLQVASRRNECIARITHNPKAGNSSAVQ